jgi:hypothetical protein
VCGVPDEHLLALAREWGRASGPGALAALPEASLRLDATVSAALAAVSFDLGPDLTPAVFTAALRSLEGAALDTFMALSRNRSCLPTGSCVSLP